MLAIDTNILVRYLTGDHPRQAAKARVLIDSEPVFVPVTVLLETEWVLRSGYGFQREVVAKSLRAFGGLPGVTFEAPAVVARALDWLDQGMDFADALHLAASDACEAFITFDAALIQMCRPMSGVEVSSP